MRRDHVLIAVWTAAAALVACTSAGAYVTAAIVLPVLFVAPGHVWSAALLPRTRGGGHRGAWAERAAIDAGLSLVLLVLGSLAIAAVRLPLERATWLALVAILVASGIAMDRVRNGRGFGAEVLRLRRPRWGPGTLLSGLALTVTIAALVTAIIGAQTAPATRFTSLGFVTGAGDWGAIVVHNEEGAARRYLLVITAPSGVIQRIPLSVASGGSWQRSVPLDVGTAANLYVVDGSGNAGQVYRSIELRTRPGSP